MWYIYKRQDMKTYKTYQPTQQPKRGKTPTGQGLFYTHDIRI